MLADVLLLKTLILSGNKLKIKFFDDITFNSGCITALCSQSFGLYRLLINMGIEKETNFNNR